MMELWERSAANITTHFRVMFRGHIPFTSEWNKEVQEKAQVDTQALQFIKEMKYLVKSRGLYYFWRTQASAEYLCQLTFSAHGHKTFQGHLSSGYRLSSWNQMSKYFWGIALALCNGRSPSLESYPALWFCDKAGLFAIGPRIFWAARHRKV